jgi:hypothetical protein
MPQAMSHCSRFRQFGHSIQTPLRLGLPVGVSRAARAHPSTQDKQKRWPLESVVTSGTSDSGSKHMLQSSSLDALLEPFARVNSAGETFIMR